MGAYGHLVEQHVREAESRRQHFDEVQDRIRHPPAADARDPFVQRLDAQRRVLKDTLELLRHGPTTHALRPAGWLRGLGFDFEQLLAAIGDRRGL